MYFYPIQLKSILTKYNKKVEIEPDLEYKQVTIKLWGKGVVLRNIVKGSAIKTKKRNIVKQNQFILSRIDARNGAFGLVPEKLDEALVSNDFPSFDINEDIIIPKYFEFLSKSSFFIDLCNRISEGTTNRVRLDVEKFLSSHISIPSLSDQNGIISILEETLQKNHLLIRLHEDLIEKLDRFFEKELTDKFTYMKKNWSKSKLGSICNTSSGGTPSRSRIDYYENGTIPWLKSGELKNASIYNAEECITENGLNNSSAKIFPKDTILIALYGANVGLLARLEFASSTNQAICALFPDENEITNDYLYWFLRSKRPDFLKLSFGGAQPNISQKLLRETDILYPNLEDQKTLTGYLDNLETKINLIKKMYEKRSKYVYSLEKSILNFYLISKDREQEDSVKS
jgi:type I restriction enzyme, S subunit